MDTNQNAGALASCTDRKVQWKREPISRVQRCSFLWRGSSLWGEKVGGRMVQTSGLLHTSRINYRTTHPSRLGLWGGLGLELSQDPNSVIQFSKIKAERIAFKEQIQKTREAANTTRGNQKVFRCCRTGHVNDPGCHTERGGHCMK